MLNKLTKSLHLRGFKNLSSNPGDFRPATGTPTNVVGPTWMISFLGDPVVEDLLLEIFILTPPFDGSIEIELEYIASIL